VDESTTYTPEQETKSEYPDFFAAAGTTTVYIDPPQNRYWVRVKNELDYGEACELDNSLVRGWQAAGGAAGSNGATADPAAMMAVVDVGKQRLMKLALYIDDWNIPDQQGKTIRWPNGIPQRMGLLKRMKPKAATMIIEEIDRLQGEEQQVALAEPRDDRDANPTSGGAPAFGSPSE
jgi:hypothetical protein